MSDILMKKWMSWGCIPFSYSFYIGKYSDIESKMHFFRLIFFLLILCNKPILIVAMPLKNLLNMIKTKNKPFSTALVLH
jgi:hypothetical protein